MTVAVVISAVVENFKIGLFQMQQHDFKKCKHVLSPASPASK